MLPVLVPCGCVCASSFGVLFCAAAATVPSSQDRFGVLIGSGIGGVEFFEDNCGKFNKAEGGAAGLKKVSDSFSTCPFTCVNTCCRTSVPPLGSYGFSSL